MSADNWAICPRCLATAIRVYDDKAAEIAASYGKVPVGEFDGARAALGERPTEDTMKSTFREDYEQGMLITGRYYVGYSGSCSECNFRHSFKHEEQVPLDES